MLLMAVCFSLQVVGQERYHNIDLRVRKIYGQETYLEGSGRSYLVKTDDKFIEGREYRFILILNSKLVEELECSGCSPTYPAQVFGFRDSDRQNKFDLIHLMEAFENYKKEKNQ
ncbi:hypothetical protein JM79_3223 [Gramella sp. Hel_I_59]|nr:hypothetical protein JM79_3223 [Gramella sp. Hel_I_59]